MLGGQRSVGGISSDQGERFAAVNGDQLNACQAKGQQIALIKDAGKVTKADGGKTTQPVKVAVVAHFDPRHGGGRAMQGTK